MSAVSFPIAEGRRALITGGASGFGAGIAAALAEIGVAVAIADIDERVDVVARTVGEGVLGIRMDVTDPSSVREGVGAAIAAFGGLDTLVNSAGVEIIKPFLEVTEDEWDHVLDVNLKGTFLVTQAALPSLIESGRGRVVNLSSAAGAKGAPLVAPYVSSKFAINGLTQALALEFAADGVRVNAVMPSSTPETAMGRRIVDRKLSLGWAEEVDELHERTIRGKFPLGRQGTVADTVNAILFLISDAGDFTTGHALAVDGGSIIGRGLPPTRRGEEGAGRG